MLSFPLFLPLPTALLTSTDPAATDPRAVCFPTITGEFDTAILDLILALHVWHRTRKIKLDVTPIVHNISRIWKRNKMPECTCCTFGGVVPQATSDVVSTKGNLARPKTVDLVSMAAPARVPGCEPTLIPLIERETPIFQHKLRHEGSLIFRIAYVTFLICKHVCSPYSVYYYNMYKLT